MDKAITIYKAELPEFFGYGCVGYGIDIKEAIDECRKCHKRFIENEKWLDDRNKYFNHAWYYYGGSVSKCVTGTNNTEGAEDGVDSSKYIKEPKE